MRHTTSGTHLQITPSLKATAVWRTGAIVIQFIVTLSGSMASPIVIPTP